MVSNKYVLSTILAIILLLYLVQNDVSGIKSAAYWGFLGIIFLLIFILTDLLYSSWIEAGFDDNVINLKFRGNLLESDSISCIACIILSFSFHTYTFSIYDCLTDSNTKSMLITTSIGIFISTMIYLLIGTVGYILYEDAIDEYFILYNNTDLSSIAVYENIAFVVNVIMSFPLTFFALRHYWIFFIKISYTLIRNKITGIDTIVHHHHCHDQEHDNKNHGKLHINLILGKDFETDQAAESHETEGKETG
jgi:amino acid permease